MLHGVDLLEEAISNDFDIELDTLHYLYSSYFSEALFCVLLKSTKYTKLWFLVVRSGRAVSCPYPWLDKFYTKTSLRAWIGLKEK